MVGEGFGSPVTGTKIPSLQMLGQKKGVSKMKKMLVFLLAAGLLLTQAAVYAQSDQTATKAPPVSQPLVREGDFAVELVEVLNIGTADNEAEAETMLGASGVAPKNGWIADYPVTPDIVGELQKAVSEAADAKRLAMGREEALKAFRTATVEAGIPIVAELSGKYPETQPQYSESSSVDDYYSSEGPPVVTYYPPPPDYGYLYAWVPCPFFLDAFFFPGFFVLHDFHKVIIIKKKVVVVTNHVTDPKTKTVALIDPVKRGTGREFMTTLNKPRRQGFASTDAQKGAASISERSHQRMESTRSSMQKGVERGTITSGAKGMPERSFQGNERSFNPPSVGGKGSFGASRAGGGFSGHGNAGRCVGHC